jgi:hypothetical protein
MGENIPKNHNKYEIASKFTKMAIKYTNIFHSKNLQNLPKLGFFVENMPSGNPESIATENCA